MRPEDKREFRANDVLTFVLDIPREDWPWWCAACGLGAEAHKPCPRCGTNDQQTP